MSRYAGVAVAGLGMEGPYAGCIDLFSLPGQSLLLGTSSKMPVIDRAVPACVPNLHMLVGSFAANARLTFCRSFLLR